MPDDKAIKDAPHGLKEARAFQEKFWTAQRFVWVLFGVLILGAAFGLTGNDGYLAEREAGDASGAHYRYAVITRSEGRDLVVANLPARGGEASMFLSRDFLDLYTVLHMQPLPERSLDSTAGSTLFFPVAPGTSVTVRLELEARSAGLFRVSIGSNEDTRFDYRVLSLP